MAKRLEYACWTAALVCALCLGFAHQQAHAARMAAVALNGAAGAPHTAGPAGVKSAAGSAGDPAAAATGVASENTAAASGSVLGMLHIPAIGLSVPVVEDDTDGSLLRGVGHIHGTALPGGLGTVGLAGHRDTFLRPLQGIKPAMHIELSHGAATYEYIVYSTEIVKPEAVRVLDIQDDPELVLVTCYPFHYIGAAPMRFIVHAHLVSLMPNAGQ